MKGEVNAAPNPPPASGMLEARARSFGGIHVALVRLKLGHAAASPMPRQNRATISVTIVGAIEIGTMSAMHAVSAVNADHHRIANASTARGPKRSAIQPPAS